MKLETRGRQKTEDPEKQKNKRRKMDRSKQNI